MLSVTNFAVPNGFVHSHERDAAVITEVSVGEGNWPLRDVKTRTAVDKESGVVANDDEVADVVSSYEPINGFHDVPMKT